MEQKTILEELLERSPDKVYNTKLETAFRLSAKGKYEEAATLFDELLSENPDDTEAVSGKKLNDRRRSLDRRINDIGKRRREAKPQAGDNAESGASFLRSKKVLTAIIIAFVIVCAAAVAAVGVGQYEAGLDDLNDNVQIAEVK